MAVFTSLPVAVQLCLNGEPILSLQPDTTETQSSYVNSQGLKDERCVCVTYISMHVWDTFISIIADADVEADAWTVVYVYLYALMLRFGACMYACVDVFIYVYACMDVWYGMC